MLFSMAETRDSASLPSQHDLSVAFDDLRGSVYVDGVDGEDGEDGD
jgi:hypothetical protein